MKLDNDLEKFKRRYKDKLNSVYNQILLHAVLGELEKAYGNKRAVFKWMAIASKIRKMYEEILTKYYKDGIDKTMNEIGAIGLHFTYPDLRGVHRKRELPQPRLLEEYDELH